jgi:hypothetical protein
MSRLTRIALLAALAWVTASFLVQELYRRADTTAR